MTIKPTGLAKAFYILRKIDPTTNSWTQQLKFSVSDRFELKALLSVEVPEVLTAVEIGADDYFKLVERYSLAIDTTAEAGELECAEDEAELDFVTHTGRELLLMLQRKKPFAAFVEVIPDDCGLEIIPEKYFDPYVCSGKMSKFEYQIEFTSSKHRKVRRVLYALKGQEWRFEAHKMLWMLAGTKGWNGGFETVEGFLLGYEVDVDWFFVEAKY
jgi:hypothetical protein